VDFTAIDFETANPSSASACSIGLVKVRGGAVVDRLHRYIRPPFPHDEFSEWNVRVHGITRDMVADAAGWAELLPVFREFADGSLCRRQLVVRCYRNGFAHAQVSRQKGRVDASGSVAQTRFSRVARAVRAAIHLSIRFHVVADDPAAAMCAHRCQPMNRALEAVENM
jgi:hypothetical protein